MAEYGRIDILCNVAGAILHKDGVPIEDQDPAVWDKQFKLNVIGTMNVTQAVVPLMRAQKYGVIVNIGSGSTHRYDMGVGPTRYPSPRLISSPSSLLVSKARPHTGQLRRSRSGPYQVRRHPPRGRARTIAGRGTEEKGGLPRRVPAGRMGTAEDNRERHGLSLLPM